MNELDLTPFKVEFDRDIIYTSDLIPGDYLKIMNGSEEVLLGLYIGPDSQFVDGEECHYHLMFCFDSKYGSNGLHFIALDKFETDWTIYSIYRIPKFKY